jgi:hypothetical protein
MNPVIDSDQYLYEPAVRSEFFADNMAFLLNRYAAGGPRKTLQSSGSR